ncbi:MAG: DMT family transporter [Gammaproteobacteria bacterium]
MPYEFAALGAAFSWVFASLLAADSSREIGGVAFNRIRVSAGFVMLLMITLLSGELLLVSMTWYPLLVLSGLAGLAIGDTALFAAFKRLGPRRAQILYACNAPIAVVLGMVFLGESPSIGQIAGIVSVFSGVVIAIIWGKRASQLHRWEQIQGAIWIGVGLGLVSALGQALGSLLVKPALDAGVDPMAASTVRIGAATILLIAMRQFGLSEPAVSSIASRHVFYASMNALLAIVVGVSLLLWAFAHGDVGIGSILASTTPVLILPWLWYRTGERPAAGAWIGALIAVLGTAAILRY